MAKKLQINKMVGVNLEKEKDYMKGVGGFVPFGRTFGKNDKISGWHTQDYYDDV
jgi:hypothetical protein